MARRQARRRATSGGSSQPLSGRPQASRWRYWLMVVIVAVLAVIMVVTSLPLQ